MDKEPESRVWWQTLPGILTAAAGIVTAFAGLIVALHQAGFLDRQSAKSSPGQPGGPVSAKEIESPARSATSGNAMKPPPMAATSPEPVPLPVGLGKITAGQSVYEVLSARLGPYAPGQRSLKFEVRMTNTDRYDQNFWAASFRLRVDGVLRAPVNDLNELVKGNSSKEGAVEFVIPDSSREVGLQVGEVGEAAPTTLIALKAGTSR